MEEKENKEDENRHFTSEEVYWYINYIQAANRKIDKHHINTLVLAENLTNKFQRNNALEKMNQFILDSKEITGLGLHEYSNTIIIEKFLHRDVKLNGQWRITKLSISMRTSGGTFILEREDKTEYEMAILWDMELNVNVLIHKYIDLFKEKPFDLQDKRRILALEIILSKINTFHLVCLTWNVEYKLLTEPQKSFVNENEIIITHSYEKTLIHIRYYTTSYILLPGGDITNTSDDSIKQSRVILLLLKDALIPIAINAEDSMNFANHYQKLTTEAIKNFIRKQLKNINQLMDIDLKTSGKELQPDICYNKWIGSGEDNYFGISNVGVFKYNSRTFLVDNKGNIWEKDQIIDCYNEKIINLCIKPKRANGITVELNFDRMYDPPINLENRDYFPFWNFVYEKNLTHILFIIAIAAYGLSFDLQNKDIIKHIFNDYGIRSKPGKNAHDFINPLICYYGVTTTGKTSTVATLLQVFYNLARSLVILNQSWTCASISQITHLLGSFTALHDDVLRKSYSHGTTLPQFIMSIASKMSFKIASETTHRGSRNASILTAEKDIFESEKLNIVKEVTGTYSRLLSFEWHKVDHSKRLYNEMHLLLTNFFACTQTYWIQCKWINNLKVVVHIRKEVRREFGKEKYDNYIRGSRTYGNIQSFVSFIYDYVLDFLWIKYNLDNLQDCKIMKGIMLHVNDFYKNSYIQN